MPATMGRVSSEPDYREALDVLAERGEDLAVLPGCLRRLAECPLFKGLKVPPRLERWLLDGKWKFYLPQPELALGEGGAPSGVPKPPSLPKDVSDVVYPAGLAPYLAGAVWHDEDRLLVCRLGMQVDEVNKRVLMALRGLGVSVVSLKQFEQEGLGS